MAAVLSVGCYSYSYSDTIVGITNNAAKDGFTWSMQDVLPPQAGLTVGGVFYEYTTEKEPDADMQVHLGNIDRLEGGYVWRETDDWSGVAGSNIRKIIPLNNVPRERFGTGSIEIEGEGQVLDPTLQYTYRYDECYIVLSNPECPGYLDALLAWLEENGMLDNPPSPGDPYYDEWVQATLNRETEENDDEVEQEESEASEDIEELNGESTIDKMVDAATQQVYTQLSQAQSLDKYVQVELYGGFYEDSVVLQDSTLQDNRRALNNLAQQQLHRDMVRSQYDRN